MPSWSQILAQAERSKVDASFLKPYVTPKHYAWLERSEVEQLFSPTAVQRGLEVMQDKHKNPRGGRFSASGLGHCPRRQVFAYTGTEAIPPSTVAANIMRAGTAAHFWIMLEGLTMGWLVEAEVWFHDKDIRVGGTLDGIMDDNSIWEYKSVASSKFKKVTTPVGQGFGPLAGKGAPIEHLVQLDAYEILTDEPKKSLFYEERNFGEFYEYRLDTDKASIAKTLELIQKLNGHVDDNTLPPMLADCELTTGYIYSECPFREVCPTRTKAWE